MDLKPITSFLAQCTSQKNSGHSPKEFTMKNVATWQVQIVRCIILTKLNFVFSKGMGEFQFIN